MENRIFFLEWHDIRIYVWQQRKRERKMENLIVLNTVSELRDLINTTTMTTFVGRVAFAMDLLESVRQNDNMIEINHELGFCDDGGFIQIDEMGYVVDDYAIQ
jgi:hypothetical protein